MIQILLYTLLSPIIWLVIIAFALIAKKGRERILKENAILKKALIDIQNNQDDKKLLIFHAASAGEFEQLKPLLPLIDRDKYFVLQTFASPTIYRKEYDSNLFDAVCYHPLDSVIKALLFFKKVKPTAYILNRHDLWPAHLFIAKILKIKTILINANMHEKSGRYKFPFRSLNRWMFESIDLILCGSKRVRDGIEKLAPKANVEIAGETRFDQVTKRKENNPRNHFNDDIMDFKNIVLGSIIHSDYDVVFGGIKKYWKDKSGTKKGERIIAVPHEVANKDILQLEEKLSSYGFSYHRYSESRSCGNSDVIIIDTVGILAELYVYADSAYVGAGFGAGVHNVIEPAVYGVPTFFGPNYHILDEAVAMADNSIATVINTDEDVYEFLIKISDESILNDIREKTLKFVSNTSASSQKIINRILEIC